MGRKRKVISPSLCCATLNTPIAIYQSYKGNMLNWYNLPESDKYRVVEEALKELSPLDCIGKCGEELPDNVKDAIYHLNRCILSKYYNYIDNADAFRRLSRDEQKTLAREATYGNLDAPCLNVRTFDCAMKYNHYNALTYHVNRCRLDPENMPWECYRCGYRGNKSESVEHLTACKRKMQAEAERIKRELIISTIKQEPNVEQEKKEVKKKKTKAVPKKVKLETQELLKSMGFDVSQESDEIQDELQPSTSQVDLYIPTDEPQTVAISVMGFPGSRGRKSQASVALGVAPKNSRARNVDGQKRYKFKTTTLSTAKPDLSIVRDYIREKYEARFQFWNEASSISLSRALFVTSNDDWIRVDKAHPSFAQWYSRKSIGFALNDKLQEEHLEVQDQGLNNKFERNVEENELGRQLNSIPLFDSKLVTFNFDRGLFSPVAESSQVTDIYKRILPSVKNSPLAAYPTVDELFNMLKAEKKNQQTTHVLFCGGPISSIRSCPQLTKQGYECVAISTFNDEKFLVPLNSTQLPSYVQFWLYDPMDFTKSSKPWFIMEVPDSSAITDMCWCPLFSSNYFSKIHHSNGTLMEAQKGKLKTKQLAKPIKNDDSHILGLLAVATNNGQVLIYSIPHEIENHAFDFSTSSKFLPPIYSTTPIYSFKHPDVEIQLPEKDEYADRPVYKKPRKSKAPVNGNAEIDQEVHELSMEARKEFATINSLPFTSIEWSPFNGGQHIAGVSPAGKVYIWDLESLEPKIPSIILEIESVSPPVSIAWINATKICVSLRDRVLRFYDIMSLEMIQEDDSPRSAGAMVISQPELLPGVVAFDTAMQAIGEILVNSPTYYIINQESNTIIAMPISNSHQLSCTRVRVCGHTGSIVSIGADGRLVYSLNGRLASHNQKEDYIFNISRPHLQMVRHRSDAIDNVPLIKHDDCVEGMWIELRMGDGALIDQQSANKFNKKISDVIADRRVESLTCIDVSQITAGLSICGGEAGLVFISQCYL